MRLHRRWTVLWVIGLASSLLLSGRLFADDEKKANKDDSAISKGGVEKLLQDLRQQVQDLQKEVKDLHRRLEALEKGHMPGGLPGQPGFVPPNLPPFIGGGGIGAFGGNFGPLLQTVKVVKALKDKNQLVLRVEQPNQFQVGQTFMAQRRAQAGPPLGFLKITQVKEKEKEVIAELQPLPIPAPIEAPRPVRADEELQLILIPGGAGFGGLGNPAGGFPPFQGAPAPPGPGFVPPGAPGTPPGAPPGPGFVPPGAPGAPPGPFPPPPGVPPAPLRD